MIEWTDVHTHLNMQDMDAKDVIKEASSVGVTKIITIGTEPYDWQQVLHNAKSFPQVKGALGVHPQHAVQYNDDVEQVLKTHLTAPSIVACGEIGLDYHYDNIDKKLQQEVFEKQMTLAGDQQLPVEIHTRDAENDTKGILKKFKGQVRGLLHCFTGTWDLAKWALDMGFHISFSGVVTFKNAQEVKEVCQKVPLDCLHLETDAPYLAPVPFRGKKNKPAWLTHTAQGVADLHGVSLEKLSHITQANCNTLFHF